jgi:hypothetical protein
LLFGVLAASVTGFPQSTSQLRGTITDPQGAVISTTRVTLSSTGTGFNRQMLTNAGGEYQFLQVPPGTYKVVAEMAGFTSLTRTISSCWSTRRQRSTFAWNWDKPPRA